MKLISQPLDFLGQNIYNAVTVRAGEDGKAVRAARYDGFPQTAIGWPVTPEVLYWAPKFMQERYKKPFMITENGMASHDWVGVDGKVHDQARVILWLVILALTSVQLRTVWIWQDISHGP